MKSRKTCRASEKHGISEGTKKYIYQEHQNEREKGNKSEKNLQRNMAKTYPKL